MKKIKFSIDELEKCFYALSYMFIDSVARKEYVNISLDYEISYPQNKLDIISKILLNYNSKEIEPLQDINVVKNLMDIKKYSDITSYSMMPEAKIYYKYLIDRIKGNTDKIDNTPLISYKDNKQAFKSFIGGNLKALINSDDKNKYAFWNGRAWKMYTEENAKIIYGEFINKCQIELSNIDDAQIIKKINTWDSKNKTIEALESIRRDLSRTIDMAEYKHEITLIPTKNGKIIDLNKRTIKDTQRDDLILYTSPYNLMDREESIKFMNENVLNTYKKILGYQRLNYLLDFIANKMLGHGTQKALFLIGSGSTGKTVFKNIITDLLTDRATRVNYAYFTLSHKGNDDTSRDDTLVSLNNKLLVMASEPDNDKSYTMSNSRFKTVLSNSTETARATRGQIQEINLQNLDIIIDTNNLPIFNNIDYAIERRLQFIRFTGRIENPNPNFYTEVIKPNFDYVFSYFVYRALELKELIIPDVIKNDTKQKICDIDPIEKFATNNLEYIKGSKIKIHELMDEYSKFCDNEGFENTFLENIEINDNKNAKKFFYLLREKDNFRNITFKRVSNGSTYNKTYAIFDIMFKCNGQNTPFDAEIKEENNQQQLNIEVIQPNKEISWNINA